MNKETRLTVHLENKAPVALFDFTNSFHGLADEYARYVRYHEPEKVVVDGQLYLREVRQGSIIIDLIAMSAQALPFVEQVNSVLHFGEFLGKLYGYLLGENTEQTGLKRQDFENAIQIVEPVAKDSAAQINFQPIVNGNLVQHFHLNSREANAVQNAARREIESLKEPVTGIRRNVVLYLYQVRDDTRSAAGDRGIIESISPFPVKVRFQNEEIKSRVLHAHENPFLYAYLIDVSVETIEGKPVVYNILAVHEAIERHT